MKQIQQFQEQQPNWQQLPQEERQTNENQVLAKRKSPTVKINMYLLFLSLVR